MNLVEVELLILILLVVLLGGGAIEQLTKIHGALEDATQRAMLDTEVIVQAEKVKQPCQCGHAKSVHWQKAPPGIPPEARGVGPCHALVSTDRGVMPLPLRRVHVEARGRPADCMSDRLRAAAEAPAPAGRAGPEQLGDGCGGLLI